MQSKTVSRKLLKRLPVYLNYLKNLPEDSSNVSATAMAKALELGDVQVRKDLAKVSTTGRRRTGRNRHQLMQDIEEYLNFAEETGTIVVGTGKLGRALLDYVGFEDAGFNVMAGFDIDPCVDLSASRKPIYPINRLEYFCKHYEVHIGVIAVPAESAQEVCDTLVACGIRAIWNFAPVHLQVPDYVTVQSENLAVSLTSLRMQMKNRNGEFTRMNRVI
jgi:redox-sensing transcriptional repressor